MYDDIILVREAKELIIEEVFAGKLFYIFRSPKKLVELTEDLKEKQGLTNMIDTEKAHLCVCFCLFNYVRITCNR